MNKWIAGIVLTAFAGAASWGADDVPELPAPQKEHEWLERLVGKWRYEARMFMGPGQPPVETTGTETVRAIGGFWILAETSGKYQDVPFTGLLTLGFDVQKGRYVGTWVDSMTGYLWTYEGTVDPSGKVLTLESEGPSPGAPDKRSRYKEVLEVKSKDEKVFTSSVQGEDGEWITIITIEYRRQE